VKRGIGAAAVTLCLATLGAHWIARGHDADAQTGGATQPGAPFTDEIGDRVQTLPRGQLPGFTQEGDAESLYRFATTHGDVLRWMPCTCGCAQVGHTSNRSCYIKSETHAEVTYTSHAAT